jgi:arsenite methyltransferase
LLAAEFTPGESLQMTSERDANTTMQDDVRQRYADAASTIEADLCCPDHDYNSDLLKNVPEEIVEVDYGCGDPTRWLAPGETVLDLGSGSGKVCYLAAQIVGSAGRVIGVDFNEPMLALARRHRSAFAERVGFDNIEFRKGRIQDLALDLDDLEAWLADHPVGTSDDLLAMESHAAGLRTDRPMIATDSVDCIVSNCVLNLVDAELKSQLFTEMFRVLKPGGRCVISDIVSDEDIPTALQQDPELWSGCISGAFREDAFLDAFAQAGFYGMEIVERADNPWKVVEGIEFRSTTVRAFKGKQGPCLERNQAVIYRGPWSAVVDDDGHTLYRGERMAVCDKTFRIYGRSPYAADIVPVPPRVEIEMDAAAPFDCSGHATRDIHRSPRETKGEDFTDTSCDTSSACGEPGCC